jgi:YidC/Oxa1 family membrane protein insertase
MEKKELSTETRLMIAIAATFIIIFASRYILPKPPAAPQKAAPTAAKTQQPATATPAQQPAALQPPAGENKQGTAEEQITVESDNYQIVFSSRGGVVKSWALKKYRDSKGEPLDLVDAAAAAEFGNPFGLWVADEGLRGQLNSALFVPSSTGRLKAPVTLAFDYSGNGVVAHKELTIPASGYVVETKTELWSGGKPVSHEIAWRGGFGDVHDIGMRGDVVDIFYRDREKITRLAANDVKTGEISSTGLYEFAGIEDRFFSAAFIPAAGAVRVTAFHHDVTVPGEEKKRPSIGIAAGAADAVANRFKFFIGPKDTDLLASVQPHLTDVVDYGWFAMVAKPLFLAMRWIHDTVVANYGWSIIILTVVINFALFPLKISSLRSTMKMQKLQPQIRAIQDKYKQYKMKDPRKAEMNQELMAFYKKNGVNPFGGCLPMVIQLPFLYGFYKVLIVSIEMRHAPWILWIHDLSAPEPGMIKVLPLLMCATQFLLQKMSPSPSPDPAQQKMMMFMPVMFLYFFWGMSSGLVLYWLTQNVVGIAQQWYINKTELHPAMEKKARGGKKQAALNK